MTEAAPNESHSYPHGSKPRSLRAIFALSALMALLPATGALAQANDNPQPARSPATAPAATTKPATPFTPIESTTALSARLAKISHDLNAAAPDVHIAMMDRDWFQQNLALEQVAAQPNLTQEQVFMLQSTDGSWEQVNEVLQQIDPDAAVRQKLIADFVKSRAGVTVDPARFSTFSVEMDVTDGEGATLPGGSGASNGLPKAGTFCTVFGEFADLDAETMTRTTSGLNGRGMNPNLDGRPLLNVLPLDVLRKTVDYHEDGHCYFSAVKGIDRGATFDDQLKKAHASETYADIFSVLLLAHYDGVTNAANILADQRLVDNALREPFIAKDPDADQRDPEYYGVFIHTTTDGLRAAQKEIDRLGLTRLQAMSINDLRAKAFEILDSVPEVGFAEVFVLTEMQKHLYDTSFMTQLRADNPEMSAACDYALRMRDEMNAAIPRIVDISNLDPHRTPLEQIQFNFDRPQITKEQYIAIMTQRQAELDTAINAIKDQLVLAAGGPRANDAALVRVFDARKDAARHTLENGSDADRKAAMKTLALIGEALNRAVIQVDGAKVPTIVAPPANAGPAHAAPAGEPNAVPTTPGQRAALPQTHIFIIH
jgi:hypothetical protein